jgi:hypothetical protein
LKRNPPAKTAADSEQKDENLFLCQHSSQTKWYGLPCKCHFATQYILSKKKLSESLFPYYQRSLITYLSNDYLELIAQLFDLKIE